MVEYTNDDAKIFDHINNVLVGEFPSFGIAKESKFQQLMQRNQSYDASQQPLHASQSEMLNYNKYDTSLSVEAKAFQPSIAVGNQFSQQAPMPGILPPFANLDISGSSGGPTARPPMGSQPNPSAHEFIPRNMSAPVLNPHNGGFSIPEFIPNHPMARPNGPQAQTPSFIPTTQQPTSYLMQQTIATAPDAHMRPQHVQSSTSSPIVDYIPGAASLLSGNHMPSPVPGPALEPKLSASSSGFASPPSQNNSSTYYTADSSTSHTAGSHGGRRRACTKDLKVRFRFIEECVQKFLNRKDVKDGKQTHFNGFTTPGTSSPYSRQTVDSLSTNHTTPDRSSPLLSRRLAGTHRGSPSLAQVSTGVGVNMSDAGILQQPVAQENGGTTYFYTQKSNQQGMSVVMPPCHVFPGSPPSIEYMSLKANAPSFFMANELRQAIMHKHSLTMLTVDTEQDPSVPAEVDNYHSLFPLEYNPEAPLQKSGTFRYVTTCYKAIKYKDGLPYCLRRIHGFRQVNEKCMVLVDMWKKLQHSNVVQLREVFTSKAFGEHSLIFAHDYYAGAETLMARHFQNPNNNYASKTKWNGGTTRQNAGLLPESLIWTYVVQLTSALRCIHMAGLACRVLDPTKVIITDKSRLRINSVGILDVLAYDNSHANPRAHIQQYQQDDMVSLGKVVLALACNSMSALNPDTLQRSIELVVMNYSSDLKNLILYLLTPQQRPHNVNDIMPMIGARFYMQLDAAMMRADVIENELAKEVENGRLFRMLGKLGVINERPEFGMEPAWSETGDRYLLKLFRDHLFHQVTETGAPWVDLAHIVQCLNKLDAGVPEKVCLMSRDEQNVLVVSYAELKKAFSKCFNELLANNTGV